MESIPKKENCLIKYLPFREKSLEVLKTKGFLTVLEGSVRATKTFTANWYFLEYILESTDDLFLILGVSSGSIKRNVTSGDFGLIALSNNLLVEKKDSKGYEYLQLTGTNKKIYMFGGQNVSSYKIFRGITAGGVYIDEVNQCHPNTIAESFNRTIVSNDRRHIWTLNPDVPAHWVYSDYLDRYDEEQPKGYKWFHFVLDDNPALTEERKEQLKGEYTGLFYQKFILGLRVSPDGACYTSFSNDLIIKEIPKEFQILKATIGVDIGGNGSATAFNATLTYRHNNQLGIIIYKEHCDRKNESVEKVKEDYLKFITMIKSKYIIQDVYVDSAEQLILKSFRNMGLVNVRNSLKRPIVDRIRLIDFLMANKRCYFMEECKETIKAIQSAIWDSKSPTELKRLDNGSTNIDNLDSLEYSVEKDMRNFI